VTVPRARPGEAFRVYKLSKRYDQDISTVCGAFRVAMEGGDEVDRLPDRLWRHGGNPETSHGDLKKGWWAHRLDRIRSSKPSRPCS
jgi:hypothetical protein